MSCGFWPMVHSQEYPWSSQSFPSERTTSVSSRSFTVTNKSYSLQHTVAASFVCTSPLAVTTVVGLLETIAVSNSAEFRSFLRSMHIDAVESTTIFLSSGFMTDSAGRHQTSEGEKKIALSVSFSFKIFLASLHTSPWAHRSSKFWVYGLRWWGFLTRVTPCDGPLL